MYCMYVICLSSYRFMCWCLLTLLGPAPPQAEGYKGHNDEDEGAQDHAHYEVGQVAGARHRPTWMHRPLVRSL